MQAHLWLLLQLPDQCLQVLLCGDQLHGRDSCQRIRLLNMGPRAGGRHDTFS
jgi:hypothetical protein